MSMSMRKKRAIGGLVTYLMVIAAYLVCQYLLATGGTALAACRLAEQLGGKVVAVRFAIELEGMGGREKLRDYDVDAVMTFPGD